MRAGRWASAAATALALAIVPGALRLAPAEHTLERARPTALGSLEALARPVATVPPPASPPGPVGALPDEVAITPPAELSGELAPAVPVAAPFQQASVPGGRGEVFALVIGINDYPGDDHDLGQAVADADTIEQALDHFGVPSSNQVVLRDGQARRDQVVAAVQALVRRAAPGTTVVLAYAGHVRKLDSDTEALIAADGELITDQELAGLLGPSRADKMWLLLATCFAGGFTELLAPGRILTGAADSTSLAYESPSINGSYLVHHLVREGWLEGRAGPSVQEAFAYADAQIRERYPDRRPVEFDELGSRLRLGSGATATSPSPQGSPSSEPPPSSPTTTEPERACTLVIFCRRS